jgi:hypothetical protein
MSTRERWIVYPLLFLALGAAIKPKLVPPELRTNTGSAHLNVDRLRCRELYIVGTDDVPRIRMAPGKTSGDGEIQITDSAGKALVRLRADAASRAGLIETLRDDGKSQTAMMSSESGGEVIAFDNALTTRIILGHREGAAGVFETNLKTGREKVPGTDY